MKLQALQHYSHSGSMKCDLCGFSNVNALVLQGSGGEAIRGHDLYAKLKNKSWPEAYRVLCRNCTFITTERGTDYQLKRQVFRHYSSKKKIQCDQCGFSDIRALSLDHVEGGGQEHMRELGIESGLDFYKWLKAHHYPNKPRLQVLCMNCQFIKAYENLGW